MEMKKDELEAIKFLMDCGFKEATLFWNRNGVFLLANLATFSASFAYLTNSEQPVGWGLRIGIGLFGVILCSIWALVVQAGRRMNHVWVHEAKQVAERLNHINIKNALNGTPSDSVSKGGVPSATRLMYWLATVFGIVWVSVSLIGKGGII